MGQVTRDPFQIPLSRLYGLTTPSLSMVLVVTCKVSYTAECDHSLNSALYLKWTTGAEGMLARFRN